MTINRLNQGTTNQVLVKAISGQTTNLLELQDSSGSVVSSIGPTGALGGTVADPYSGAWISYTPTWTNLTVGNGTNNFAYKQIGKSVFVRGLFTLGSTSSISGSISVSLPITANNLSVTTALGTLYLEDAGVAGYPGVVLLSATPTTVTLRVFNAAGTYAVNAGLSSTVPFTWGTSDHFSINFTYEAA